MSNNDSPPPEANLQLLQVEDDIRTPPSAGIAGHYHALQCSVEGHTDCKGGCRTGPNFLAAAGYIRSDPASGYTTFTALLVWALAHFTERGVQFSWSLLDGIITTTTDSDLPVFSYENLRATVKQRFAYYAMNPHSMPPYNSPPYSLGAAAPTSTTTRNPMGVTTAPHLRP